MYTDRAQKKQDPSIVTRSKTTFNDPLKWMAHETIFTCSWSDFFHGDADPWRLEAWQIIRRTPQHTYLILTKRPELMPLPWDSGRPWPHVWLGVSAENQQYADERIPPLLDTAAAHRFLSIEPLLGPIDLSPYLADIDWLIVGGESGPHFRTMEIAWLEEIVTQCEAARVPIFVKQDGARQPEQQGRLSDALWKHKVTTDDIDLDDMTEDSEALVEIPDQGPPDLERIREIHTTCTLGHVVVLRAHLIHGSDSGLFGDGVQICYHPDEEDILHFAKKTDPRWLLDIEKKTGKPADLPDLITWLQYTYGFAPRQCWKPVIHRRLFALPVIEKRAGEP